MEIVGLLFVLGSLYLIFETTDRLIQYQYKFHNDEWVRDGKPRGVRWEEPGLGFFGTLKAQRSGGSVTARWLFHTPSWIKGNRRAVLYLWLHRISVFFLFSMGILGLIV